MSAFPKPKLITNLIAGADLSASQYKAVAISAGAIVVAGAGAAAIGFLMNAPVSGQVCEVATASGGAKATAAGTIAAGDKLRSDASGNVVSVYNDDAAVAIALESAVSGDIFSVLVITSKATLVQTLTATGTVTPGKQSVELNHATVAVAATIANAANHKGLFILKDTSASGTAGHTLTLTAGTFNGTNNIATMNAPNDALVVYFDSAGNGTILANVGSVALS